MSDVQTNEEPRKNPLRPIIWGVALVGVAVFLYVIGAAAFKPADKEGLIAYRRGALAKLEIPGERLPDAVLKKRAPANDQPAEGPYSGAWTISPPAAPAPDFPLVDDDGKTVTLADYRGNVVVLNLWATWCAPCKIEMPTLNALSAAYAVQRIKVLAVSVDRPKDHAAARAEMAKYPALPLLFDDGYKLAFGMTPRAEGMPTTVIFDKKGVERARITGEADWNSQDARALIEALLKE